MAGKITMDELPGTMAQINRAFKKGVDRFVQTAAMAFQETAVRLTPVDTGKARSNWRASIDSFLYGERKPYSPYPKRSGPKLSESANADAAISQAYRVVRQFNSDRHSAIVIQNNSPYIGKLDDGTQSNQSANMVLFGLIHVDRKLSQLSVIDTRVKF